MAVLQSVVRYAYAPFVLLFFPSVAIAIVAGGGAAIELGGLFLVAVGLSFAAEAISPYEQTWNKERADRARDFAHAVVNEGSVALSVLAIPLIAAQIPWSGVWPGDWSLGAQLALAILVADAGITLAHRASHRLPILWRFHAVHHSPTRMYGLNGLLKHPLHQGFETLCGTTPLVLLGMPIDVAMLLGFAAAVQLLLQHSNVDIRIGPLVHVWAIAPGHRHHHRADGHRGDVNFGLFTTFWDHLLGSYASGADAPRDGELGAVGRADYPTPYLRQLIEPFRFGR